MSQTRHSTFTSSYTVCRLNVPVPSVRGFQRSYEAAVPNLPLDDVQALIERGAHWSEMVALIDAHAQNGFLIYFRNDVHPVMSAAGDQTDCIASLMGNRIIAERMFRYEPRAMLYAPLHTVIWEDIDGQAWFTVDQPSTQFASFEISAVTEVGLELDRKLAELLAVLEVEVPPELRRD
jgi:uncharacterized protein (DUF302 family)